ncbi:MAG TPA: ATP-dependent DNA helicase RecG [Firmicutes bacterium]|nr:ATP-dependent DNA helicase RecG [Bacillota bacterium]
MSNLIFVKAINRSIHSSSAWNKFLIHILKGPCPFLFCYYKVMKLSKSTKLNDALLQMGLRSPIEVINHLPYRYDDYSLTPEVGLSHGKRLVLFGTVITAPIINFAGRFKIITFNFKSNGHNLYRVTAFNRPYLRSAIRMGGQYTIIATYDRLKHGLNFIAFKHGAIKEEDIIKPIYSLISSIDQHVFHRLVRRLFNEAVPFVEDIIPIYLQQKYRLLPKVNSLKLAHFPTSFDDVRQSLRTLKYEEALLFSLKTLLIRRQNQLLTKSSKPAINLLMINDFVKRLPFKLSHDQLDAVRDIINDMNKAPLMYRLLQGDVGSGKTVVASIALYANYLRKDQGALMAPTDALAKQHFLTLNDFFKGIGVQIGLLVGSKSRKERDIIKEMLLDGVLDIVVGTHALFSEDVVYQSLGLAIIDEQHRFGVNQRSLLSNKGTRADLLLMSATPIPRTLALTLYSDLDITTIKQFPFLKRHVTTSIHKSDDRLIHELIKQSLRDKRRIFIVAPLIDEGEITSFTVETLFDQYEQTYPGLVSLLHGRLGSEDKDQSLDDFTSGRTPILVSTTVIEVGIDVPSADLMIVYDAERFGLASLHQLRGRIGRDGSAARFMLVTDIELPDEHARLKVLIESNDGFYIAEQDLKFRGPGELAGQRQAGMPNFAFINLYQDHKMLEYARMDAIEILSKEDQSSKKIIEVASKNLDSTPYA